MYAHSPTLPSVSQVYSVGDTPTLLCKDDMPSLCMFLCFAWGDGTKKLLPPGDTPHAEYSAMLSSVFTVLSPAVMRACHELDDARRSGLAFESDTDAELPPALATAFTAVETAMSKCVFAAMYCILWLLGRCYDWCLAVKTILFFCVSRRDRYPEPAFSLGHLFLTTLSRPWVLRKTKIPPFLEGAACCPQFIRQFSPVPTLSCRRALFSLLCMHLQVQLLQACE